MAAAQTTTGGTVNDQITVANLQHIGSGTATGALGTTMPRPTVFGNEASTAGAEGVILAITLGNGRGVVDIRLSYLGIDG